MGLLNTLYLAFFAIHIPTTLFVDSQSVLPRSWFPKQAVDLLAWHIKTNKDDLVRTNPPWFVSLVACELFLQLPFFFVAVYAFATQKRWIRLPALIYGVHTATTMVPILYSILTSSRSAEQRYQLAAIYSPYLLVPLMLTCSMLSSVDPFAGSRGKKKKNKTKAI